MLYQIASERKNSLFLSSSSMTNVSATHHILRPIRKTEYQYYLLKKVSEKLTKDEGI